MGECAYDRQRDGQVSCWFNVAVTQGSKEILFSALAPYNMRTGTYACTPHKELRLTTTSIIRDRASLSLTVCHEAAGWP